MTGWSKSLSSVPFFLESFYSGMGIILVIILIVHPQSRLILQKDLSRNTSAQVGESVAMKCIVLLSRTVPDIRWLKWNKSITFVSKISDDLRHGAFHLVDPKYYRSIHRHQSYRSELRITNNVTEDDFGLNTCYASDQIEAKCNSAFLSRYVRPTTALSSNRGKPHTIHAYRTSLETR